MDTVKPASPLVARIALGIVAAMAISIPLGISLSEARELALLEKTGQVTVGSVTKTHCDNHGKLAYSYKVNGQVYKGFDTLPDKSCYEVRVGDSIDVIYSTEKLQLSRSDSLESWRGTIVGNMIALAVISVAAVAVIVRITRTELHPE